MACSRGDQHRTQAVSADIISVSIDPERLVWLIPVGAIGAGGVRLLSGKRNNQHERQKGPTAHLTIVDESGATLPRINAESALAFTDRLRLIGSTEAGQDYDITPGSETGGTQAAQTFPQRSASYGAN